MDRDNQLTTTTSMARRYKRVYLEFVSVNHLISCLQPKSCDYTGTDQYGYYTCESKLLHHILLYFPCPNMDGRPTVTTCGRLSTTYSKTCSLPDKWVWMCSKACETKQCGCNKNHLKCRQGLCNSFSGHHPALVAVQKLVGQWPKLGGRI